MHIDRQREAVLSRFVSQLAIALTQRTWAVLHRLPTLLGQLKLWTWLVCFVFHVISPPCARQSVDVDQSPAMLVIFSPSHVNPEWPCASTSGSSSVSVTLNSSLASLRAPRRANPSTECQIGTLEDSISHSCFSQALCLRRNYFQFAKLPLPFPQNLIYLLFIFLFLQVVFIVYLSLFICQANGQSLIILTNILTTIYPYAHCLQCWHASIWYEISIYYSIVASSI